MSYSSRYPAVDPLDDCLNQPSTAQSYALTWVPHWNPDNDGSSDADDDTGRPYDSDDSGWAGSDDDEDNVFTQRLLLAPPPPLQNTAVLVNRRGAAHGASSASQNAGRSSSTRQNADRSSSGSQKSDDDGAKAEPDTAPAGVPPPDDSDGWFGRDGWLMTSMEGMPFLGFVIVVLHLIRNDKDRARRACAECSFSTIVLSGAVAGEFFGGPLGAGAGGMAATPLAILVKNYIAKDIRDPDMRAKASIVLSIKAVLKEMLLSGALSALTSFFGRWCGEWLLRKWGLEGLLHRLCRLVISRLTKSIIVSILEAMLGADSTADDIFGDEK